MAGKTSLTKSINTVSVVVGIVVAVITVFLGGLRYLSQHENDVAARVRESKSIFYEKQAQLYFDAVNTVASLGSKVLLDEKSKTDALNHFWTLYYGPLGAVEDERVDAVMVIIGKLLSHLRSPQCSVDLAALLLAHCVKHSLECTWNVGLEQPPELPCTKKGVQDFFKDQRNSKCELPDIDLQSINFSCQKVTPPGAQ